MAFKRMFLGEIAAVFTGTSRTFRIIQGDAATSGIQAEFAFGRIYWL